MIYTVTLNPSVDYFIEVNNFKMSKVNRAHSDHKVAGGKGINVSRMLKNLGVESKALGFVGGFTGAYITQTLATEQIQTDFIQVEEDTRINIKLETQEEDTEINGDGPTINSIHLNQLLDKIKQINEDDYLVLAGSIQSHLPADLYNQMIKLASQCGANVVVDTSGEPLKEVLALNPFLIKPNHHELGELFNCKIKTLEDAIPYGKKLIHHGVEHVIVSMAEKGSLLFTKEGVFYANVPNGSLVNSVGSGDSVVAGFIASYYREQDIIEAFRYGIASGSGTAFSEGLATKETVKSLLSEVHVKKI